MLSYEPLFGVVEGDCSDARVVVVTEGKATRGRPPHSNVFESRAPQTLQVEFWLTFSKEQRSILKNSRKVLNNSS